jgi:hypothetical protein
MAHPLHNRPIRFQRNQYPGIAPQVLDVFAYALGASTVQHTNSVGALAPEPFWKMVRTHLRSFTGLLDHLTQNGFSISSPGTENDGFLGYFRTEYPGEGSAQSPHAAALAISERNRLAQRYLRDGNSFVSTSDPTEAGFLLLRQEKSGTLQWFYQTGDHAWEHLVLRRERDDDAEPLLLSGPAILQALRQPEAGPLLTDLAGLRIHNFPRRDSVLALALLGGKNPRSGKFEGVLVDRVWT